MPAPLLHGMRASRSVIEFVEMRRIADTYLAEGTLPPGDYVMGWRLPSWQRPAVWTREQQVRFIESAWFGFDLGTVVVTQTYSAAQGRLDPLDGLLIDAQQRLTAVQAYLDGEMRVFGSLFPECTDDDQLRFLQWAQFGVHFLRGSFTEEGLKNLYIRLNYGGTPHAPEHHPDVWTR